MGNVVVGIAGVCQGEGDWIPMATSQSLSKSRIPDVTQYLRLHPGPQKQYLKWAQFSVLLSVWS